MTDSEDQPLPHPVANALDAPGMPMSPSGMAQMMGGTPPDPALDEKFSCMFAPLGDALGLKGIGVMAMSVEPGKRAFPYHNHHGNDELFVILSGTGTYRFGDQEHPIKPGDLCAAPKGGHETAHQIINTGTQTLRYVSISTKQDPDVFEYPDSGKFGLLAVGEGRDFMSAHLRYMGRAEDSLDYWDGE